MSKKQKKHKNKKRLIFFLLLAFLGIFFIILFLIKTKENYKTGKRKCLESDWTYHDSDCNEGFLTRIWSKKNNCRGGVSHKNEQIIDCSCDFTGKDKLDNSSTGFGTKQETKDNEVLNPDQETNWNSYWTQGYLNYYSNNYQLDLSDDDSDDKDDSDDDNDDDSDDDSSQEDEDQEDEDFGEEGDDNYNPDNNPDNFDQDFCSNGIFDSEFETDIDCGGVCGACDIGENCKIDNDCASLICNEQVCKEFIPITAQFNANQTSGRAPLTVQFTDQSFNNALTWSWDFDNDGVVDSNHQNPVYIYNSPGIYSVKLVVTDSNSSDSELKTGYIEVLPRPITRGIWHWKGYGNPWGTVEGVGDAVKESQIIADYQDREIKRVYGSYGNRTLSEPSVIAAWNKKLDQVGIESQALYGNVVSDPSQSVLVSSVARSEFLNDLQSEVVDFNNSRSDSAEKFDAIHLDIEPQALTNEWDNGTAEDKKQLLISMKDFFGQVRDLINDSFNGDSGLKLYADLGHYFDKLPSQGGQVGWSSQTQRDQWFADLDSYLDNISIMAYGLGSFSSISSTTEYERSVFNYAEVGLNIKDIGSVWTDMDDLLNMRDQIETSLEHDTALHSFRYLKPVADFSADQNSGSAPLTVNFSDSSTGYPFAWQWDFDNNGTIDSAQQNPSHTFINPGIYSVKLIITNADGADENIKVDYINVN
ncbi:MAG: PKD domain-containing protein [Candidatus Moranbacteria bacterium]|nr:PKD domain-containing protein [Candidatus Moranbacteria bacterium]